MCLQISIFANAYFFYYLIEIVLRVLNIHKHLLRVPTGYFRKVYRSLQVAEVSIYPNIIFILCFNFNIKYEYMNTDTGGEGPKYPRGGLKWITID